MYLVYIKDQIHWLFDESEKGTFLLIIKSGGSNNMEKKWGR
jgi:hypothetical protein